MDDALKKSRSSFMGSFKLANSVLGTSGNKKVLNLEVKGLKMYDKDKYKKQEQCQVCFMKFTTRKRQHHCRICANAVCSDCSPSNINK